MFMFSKEAEGTSSVHVYLLKDGVDEVKCLFSIIVI